MFKVGDKIVYGENGVCTVEKIEPLNMDGPSKDKLYYRLSPLIGSGTLFVPVDTGVFMRHVMNRDEAEALIDSMPDIEPAICSDNRFNHVDAYYRELFKQHTCETLVSILKGLRSRLAEKKTRSSRAEATMRRARDILHGELAVALDLDVDEVEGYIVSRLGG